MKLRHFTLICLLLAIFAGCHIILQTEAWVEAAGIGELDPAFNQDGLLGTLPAASFDIHDVLVQPDGKSVMVGEVNTQIFVMRITPSGYADETFGALGMVVVDLSAQGYGGAIGQAVGIQSDGKLIIGAYAAHNQTLNDWIIIRLNTDGTLDNSFDGDGVVALGAASNDVLTDLVVQADGRAVATGYYIDTGSQTGISVVRLTAAGQLDSTFDGDGIWGTPSDTFVLNPRIAVQPDGKLVIAGDNRLAAAPTNDLFVIRLLSNGALDNTFNAVGSVYVTADSSEESLGDLLIEPNGSIVLVGSTVGGSEEGVAIVRLLSSGALDSSFNNDGLLTIDVNNTQSALGKGVARQADGRLVVVGTADYFSIVPGNYYDSFVLRLAPTGELDSTFATGGIMLHDVGQTVGGQNGLFDQANSVAMQPDGKIVVAGQSHGGTLEYGYLMRLQSRAIVYLPLIMR